MGLGVCGLLAARASVAFLLAGRDAPPGTDGPPGNEKFIREDNLSLRLFVGVSCRYGLIAKTLSPDLRYFYCSGHG